MDKKREEIIKEGLEKKIYRHVQLLEESGIIEDNSDLQTQKLARILDEEVPKEVVADLEIVSQDEVEVDIAVDNNAIIDKYNRYLTGGSQDVAESKDLEKTVGKDEAENYSDSFSAPTQEEVEAILDKVETIDDIFGSVEFDDFVEKERDLVEKIKMEMMETVRMNEISKEDLEKKITDSLTEMSTIIMKSSEVEESAESGALRPDAEIVEASTATNTGESNIPVDVEIFGTERSIDVDSVDDIEAEIEIEIVDGEIETNVESVEVTEENTGESPRVVSFEELKEQASQDKEERVRASDPEEDASGVDWVNAILITLIVILLIILVYISYFILYR